MPARHHLPDPSLPFGGRLGISIDETATVLGVNRDSVHRCINDGRLAAFKFGRRTLVHAASILKLMQDNAVVPKPRFSEGRDTTASTSHARGRAAARRKRPVARAVAAS
jgi:excisionase family DNA binding protein